MLHAAEFRHFPGMIAGCVLGLIGTLLLLIQNDETDVIQRRKHGASGAYGHIYQPCADAFPLVIPLGNRQGAVEYGHTIPEMAVKHRDQLGREGDLRNQDQCLPPGVQHIPDQADINGGLPASGHSI